MTLEVKDFVKWLEKGGFNLTDFRKRTTLAINGKGPKGFSHCRSCVMGTYLATLDPDSDGCGNFVAYYKRGSATRTWENLPTWATKIVQQFDWKHAHMEKDEVTQEKFIADLKKVAEKEW